MVGGAADTARLGALGGCRGGCVGAPTVLAECVVPALLPGDAELCSRLEHQKRPLPEAFRLPLTWRSLGEAR